MHGRVRSLSRASFTTFDIVRDIWTSLQLPEKALEKLHLDTLDTEYPSSYEIGHTAQASIALSALSASLVDSLRRDGVESMRQVSVSRYHACLEYQTEKLYTLDGKLPVSSWGPIGGLHQTGDGYVRIHDNFPHHRYGVLELLGLADSATRDEVADKVRQWEKVDLETRAHENGLAVYALRSYDEWDATPQAQVVSEQPIILRNIKDGGKPGLPERMMRADDRCLRHLRVLELSRVVAGPIAGTTIASHGADVLWVTSPNLPDLPGLDRNLSRGKRTIQLDLNQPRDTDTLRSLVKDCDVFIQGYRPDSLAAKGFGAAELASLHPGIIHANLSAFGPDGPWSDRRGFDSLVQTCSGMNVSEAEHHGSGQPARPMPCQALDHTAGYLLATAISAALYRRAIEGGSWEIHVSLAAVAKYLRSLGQLPGKTGFDCPDPSADIENIPNDLFEEQPSGFGLLRALKKAALVEGAMPGFEHMPKPLGSDKPIWLLPN